MRKFCLVNYSPFRPRNLENAGKIHVWELEFHIPTWSLVHDLLALEIKILPGEPEKSSHF